MSAVFILIQLPYPFFARNNNRIAARDSEVLLRIELEVKLSVRSTQGRTDPFFLSRRVRYVKKTKRPLLATKWQVEHSDPRCQCPALDVAAGRNGGGNQTMASIFLDRKGGWTHHHTIEAVLGN
ncbi:hypothetical protein [Nitrosomonas sp. Is79A3]|uniref:hypothetical protein n=1 Tax=Nitrosomonas sp. (strain Is79A3) TaxID=261292 RepID=UPI0012EABBA3